MKKARAPRLEPTWHCTYEVIIKNMFDQKFVHNAARSGLLVDQGVGESSTPHDHNAGEVSGQSGFWNGTRSCR